MYSNPRTLTLAPMATSHRQPPPPPPPKPLDLEVTIVSAKHLKNVNWRSGDLKPYVVLWLDPDSKRSTKPDESGSTRPVWNERFTLPLLHGSSSSFSLDVFHSKPSETPKPLVGSLRISLSDLPDPDDDIRIRTFDLTRPSGRPQGKIRIKLCIKERYFPLPPHNYDFAPRPSYYYGPATAPLPPPPPRDYRHAPPPPPPPPLASSPPPPPPLSREYRYAHPPPPPAPSPAPVTMYGSYHETYSAPSSPYYYSGFYSSAPPLPAMLSLDQNVSGGFYCAPSAPVDYTYEQRQKGGGGGGSGGRIGVGVGTGIALGAVAGGLGGLALDGGVKYEEDKVVDGDLNTGHSSEYGDYHRANY